MSYTNGQRLAVMAFMGAVTAYLLARASVTVQHGPAGLLEAGVYGLCAALGLNFLAAAWSGLWGPGGRSRRARS